jgi:ribosome-associated translation inhibitor RaiA
MQLSIEAKGIELTNETKRQVYEKLDLALDLLEDKITSISVHLIDINGPDEGGIDKSCRIIVCMNDRETITSEGLDESVFEVIERVTDRLGVIACQRFEAVYKPKRRNSYWLYDEDDFASRVFR